MAWRRAILLLGLSAAAAMPSAGRERVMPPDTVALDEVAVTAIKGAPTPGPSQATTTRIAAPEIERLGITAMRGASEAAPNFYMPAYGTRMTSSIYVRGLGARIDQPVVGLNIDNIPYLNKDAYDFDLADLESITVIRGPQSTLYGRNAMGGVVNITTLSPLRFQGLRLMAEGGTRGDFRASAGWYGLLRPGLGMGLTIAGNYHAGYFRNTYNNSRADREEGLALRWKTAWRPRAGVMLENTASLSLSQQHGYPYAWQETGQIAYNDTCHYSRTAFADGLTVNWHPSANYSVSSITSFQWIGDEMVLDQDFLPQSYFTMRQRRHEASVTQDIVARGRHGRYAWLGGVFGFWKHTSMDVPVTFLDTGLAELIEGKRNEMNPVYPIRWDERVFPLYNRFRTPTGGFALYHRSSYSPGRFTFTADLRLDCEQARLHYRSHCQGDYTVWNLRNDPPEVFGRRSIDIDISSSLCHTYWQLLPRVAASLSLPSLGPGANVRVSAAKGYKAGGYNTQMFSDVLQQRVMQEMGLTARYDIDEVITYRPEHSWNYEAGLSASPLEGQLSLDLCAFYIDCRNQQLTLYPDGVTTGRIMANAGQSRSYGLEVQGRWQPVSRRFEASLSWGWSHATFVKFADGIHNYAGKRVPYAPAHTLMATVVWRPAFAGGRLTLGGDVKGAGRIWWDEANTASQPFYALLGLQAGWTEGLWSLELWGRNLTATRYKTFRCVSVGHTFWQLGAPWQLGLTARLTLTH